MARMLGRDLDHECGWYFCCGAHRTKVKAQGRRARRRAEKAQTMRQLHRDPEAA